MSCVLLFSRVGLESSSTHKIGSFVTCNYKFLFSVQIKGSILGFGGCVSNLSITFLLVFTFCSSHGFAFDIEFCLSLSIRTKPFFQGDDVVAFDGLVLLY